ncbi:pyrimidine-nucleoside phosphorylase [Ruoffia sp. FAM 24228]|uniref:pyrimidine-nucleoside phosphorylase n=1 Tax=unclassified Ruoffia TaxID=2862149 RepID=UPI000ED6760F|nr:pyrimidine-nucleoside phosphorylase [Aerococcaceae bacterium]
MRVVDIIEKKQMGEELTKAEIRFMVEGFTNESIPDYQMSAWMMAVYFLGMNEKEASHLTMAMVESGDQIDLSGIDGVKVDKHSTGGVGDTTTIILAPLVASAGVPVAKMSGRGLGHTGGTLDKFEAIEGFEIEVPIEKFIELVNKNKVAVVGQTGNLAPADKKMYSLRDVTSTVQSIPLIASSIMSKKIASGADAIVLDVKVGDGAFMKTVDDARQLAKTMVQIGEQVNRKTLAVISDMSQPLGFAVGNALEIKEAIDTLKGEGPSDLTELCLVLGSQMLIAANKVETLEEGKSVLQEKIENGEALETLRQFIEHQGGNPAVVDDPSLLPQAKYQTEIKADRDGVISDWTALEVGVACSLLGAGREKYTDDIDPAVGVVLKAKVGDSVKKGDPIVVIHSNTEDISEVEDKLTKAFKISDHSEPIQLIVDTINHA